MPANGRNGNAAECPVKADWFSMPYDEKTKMSWFHYEYACLLYGQIVNSRKKTVLRWCRQLSRDQIAEFCAYYSKRMQPCMYDIVEGHSTTLSCSVGYVRDYCHGNSRQENSDLTELAQHAMSDILDDCSECPELCLSEPGAYCEFFDR